ncbi:MAG: 6-phosphogluconolactonase [Proteobacteria bacterium]|nr:6-phosphogluconolactonase [Pseudomonadota bacterium]
MKPVVEIFEPRLFDGAVADEIVASVQERIAEKGRCSIALAGGSTPAGVYRSMTKPPRVSEVNWGAIDLFLGDERWVPPADDQSNYRMIQETFLSNLKEALPTIYPVDTTLSAPSAGAQNYAKTIQEVTGGSLDIVLLGIGDDGHTASLFPGSSVLADKTQIVHAVRHPSNGTERVTLAAHLLFGAWRVFFIVKGEGKAEIMRRVLNGSEPPSVLPSRLYVEASGRVTFLLDSAAAKQLD